MTTGWGDLLVTLSAIFAVGLVVGVALGVLLSWWAVTSEEKQTVCPHCHRRVYPRR